jgi:hypothetical protein
MLRQVFDILIVPGWRNTAVDTGFAVSVVPTDAESVPVCSSRAEFGMQALINQRMSGFEE